ncbi:ATP-binding protein [Cryptosporangium aurantiacum]|uniref:sensor histidine kinase n=1 Tax=Cryptosporangium aurantiacum TaxID=134849 RepID=UPI0015BFB762|nr:ATP-binding protein [Cryptosporangium aurantiacum]
MSVSGNRKQKRGRIAVAERAVRPDEVAALAARLVDAPAAVCTTIDDDQERLDGRYGAVADEWPVVCPVADGPATCLLRSDASVVVDDTGADLRWGCCSVVVSGGVRALLGVPLRDYGGRIVGALYVVDTAPRRWNTEEVDAIARLAALADARPAPGPVAVPEAPPEAVAQHPFLAAVFDTLDVGVAACDTQGRLVLYNRALRELRGLPDAWSPVDGVAASLATNPLLDADGRPVTAAGTPLLRALRGEVVEQADLILSDPGRRVRIGSARAKPIYSAEGRCLGAVVACHDITDRRRAERFADCELQVAKALAEAPSVSAAAPAVLEAVARSLQWPHAELWLLDPTSEYLEAVAQWSAPALDLRVDLPAVTGPEGIVGSVWAGGRPLWVPDLLTSPYVATGEAAARTRECARQGLRTVLAVPLLDEGVVQGVLACFADTIEGSEDLLTTLLGTIAHQIGQFMARRRADELALDLARTKDQFLALVSHEMRTPLTAISTYTELILTDPDQECSPSHRLLLERVDRNTRSLRAIVNDLLDLAALESGRFTVRRDKIDLVGVVVESVGAAATAARTAGVEIRCELPDRVDLWADAVRLRQVLDNLVSNAVKYSPHGGEVVIRVRPEPDAVDLTVSDTGIGIPEAERARLFHRFYRTSTARNHGIPGTGLGLTIVRAIVEAHGGTIGIADTTGPGTTFDVRLPTTAPAETPD